MPGIQQYTEQIEELKKKIADLQRKIDEVQKADPEQTKAEEARLEAEAIELRTREQELAKPFDEQIEQLKRIGPDKKAAYNEAMKKYCLIPGKQYGEVTASAANAGFGGSIISYRWKDAKGRQVAWAHLRFRDKPVIRPGTRKLDGTYYVTTHSDHSIWLWAGHFHIAFVMSKKEWQGKEELADVVKLFLDLKGLAEIDAASKAKKDADRVS